MKNEKEEFEKAKKDIREQIEKVKKQDLGLDADASSIPDEIQQAQQKTRFIDETGHSPLEEK